MFHPEVRFMQEAYYSPQGGWSMAAARALGAALTILGLLLFAYAIVVGASRGQIGSQQHWTSDAVAVILGWFLLIVGPALYFGKTPARLAAQVQASMGKEVR
ncbi:MAG: hypothetical protein DSY37_04130 [Hyperthermus sp.]|nr:MAG: hypothetical protein DSY37_04130 [Hyperthermus sp.]